MAAPVQFLQRIARPPLAYRQVDGVGPAIVFLPGYLSDMTGSKATALFDWAAAKGRACLLMDYGGCGQSDGRFDEQTLLDWRGDIVDMVSARIQGPAVLVGSSLGGWLMLLAALAMPEKVTALVGIAAAPDFTSWGFSDAEKALILAEGALVEETPYGDQPYVTTRAFWQSGQENCLLNAPIPLSCPVRLLHGQDDADVPPDISLKLAKALVSDDVRVTLVKGGDHRLSRDSDIALLIDTVAQLVDPR